MHEIGHAYDPKYKSPSWKGLSKKYQQLPQPPITDYEKSVYLKEPVEFDKIIHDLSQVTEQIIRIYNKIEQSFRKK